MELSGVRWLITVFSRLSMLPAIYLHHKSVPNMFRSVFEFWGQNPHSRPISLACFNACSYYLIYITSTTLITHPASRCTSLYLGQLFVYFLINAPILAEKSARARTPENPLRGMSAQSRIVRMNFRRKIAIKLIFWGTPLSSKIVRTPARTSARGLTHTCPDFRL
jgi:hypothetical protein